MGELLYNQLMTTKLTQKMVKGWMQQLAQSQGSYGRLLRDFEEADATTRKNFMGWLRSQDVETITQFVFAIEC